MTPAPRARPPAETQEEENAMSEFDDLLGNSIESAPLRAPVEDRLALFYLSGSALVHLLSEGIVRPLSTEGLPPDARFLYADYDPMRRCFSVVVSSETFAPVPEYHMLPVLMVKVTREGFAPDPDRQPDPLPELRRHEYDPDSFHTGQG